MTEREIVEKLWKAVRSDMTLMLGLTGVAEAHARPMTAQLHEDDRRTLWIFTAKDTTLARALGDGHAAAGYFASKGHDLFATLHGTLVPSHNRAMVDALWNPFVAAWYEGGKDDPKLQLLKFDLDHAEIWLNESSVMAGLKILLGSDPKKDYKDKVAKVDL